MTLRELLGAVIASAGSLLPGEVRLGANGSSLGANIYSGKTGQVFPSLVKTANASEDPRYLPTSPYAGAMSTYDPYAGSQSMGGGGGNSGVSTGGSIGGSTGGSTGGYTSGVDTARAIYEANLRRIQSIFDNTKQRAEDFRSSGKSTFDNLIKAVSDFRNRAGTLKSDAEQQITDTASGILGSNARSGREAMGTSRAMGRAMGLGDSSKFNQQNKVLSSLIGTQGSTLANKGENIRANNDVYQGRMDQAQTQENDANTYLKGVNDTANSIANTGVDQFGGNVDTATATLANMLSDVQAKNDALRAMNPLNSKNLTQFAPTTTGIVNTINSLLSSIGGGTSGQSVDTTANPYASPTYADYLKRMRGTYSA